MTEVGRRGRGGGVAGDSTGGRDWTRVRADGATSRNVQVWELARPTLLQAKWVVVVLVGLPHVGELIGTGITWSLVGAGMDRRFVWIVFIVGGYVASSR